MPKLETSKSFFWILINVILAVGVLFLLVAGKAIWKYGKSIYPTRSIAVSAEGKVTVSPDIATLSFSVISEGADPEQLQADNTDRINAALEFVKSEGVEAKDIKTAGYNLSPRYEYNEETRKTVISGYVLTQSVAVKIRDLTKVGKIFGGLPSKGVNEISGLAFSVEDPDKFLNEARKEAFEKALAKAKLMARYNNARLGSVLTFNESGGGYPMPMYASAESFGKGGSGGPVSVPTIEPGSQDVSVWVNVTYEIW